MRSFISFIGEKVSPTFPIFTIILFIISIGDAVMSYASPVFLENHLSDTFMMGVVFSTSSFIGLIYDIYAGEFQRFKKFHYFLILTAVFSVLFPATLLFLPKNALFFIIAMGMWGIYYETRSFAQFTFIGSMVKKDAFPLAWGVQSNLTALAYLVGPIIASYLLIRSEAHPFIFSLLIFIFGLGLIILFLFKVKRLVHTSDLPAEHGNLITELRIWKTLSGRIWMLWFIWFLLWYVDAMVWSIGIIFAENIKETSYLGSFFVTVYMVPHTFMGLFIPKLAQIQGKKKLAFISTIVGGAFLILLGIATNVPSILIFTFLASAAISLAFPALSATFEDYIERMGKLGPEMIGLQQTASSLGYIIGPITAGAIANFLGIQSTFSIIGYVLITAGILAVMIVPRKIYMPQSELQKIEIDNNISA